MKTQPVILRVIAAIGLFAALSPVNAQTASWKEHKGAYYWFRYPATWGLAIRNDKLVTLQAPASMSLQIEVEYNSAFGGDAEKFLASERRELESQMRSLGYTADMQSTEPGYRGGRAMWGSVTTSSGVIFTVAVNAIPFVNAVYVTRMVTPIGSSFAYNEQYFQPIMASIQFNPGSALSGKWSNITLSNGVVNGRFNSPLPLRRFAASLIFLNDGQYSYSVRQIEPSGPVWELNVQGRYSLASQSGVESMSGTLSLAPEKSQFVAPGMAASEQTVELIRITSDGLPNQERQSFDIHWDASGQALLKRLGSPNEYVPVVTFRPDNLRAVSAASGMEGKFAPGAAIVFLGSNLSPITQSQTTTPLPLSAGGVSVTLNQKRLPLFFVSPDLITAQLPVDAPLGTSVATILVEGQPSGSVTLTLEKTAPALFLDKDGRAFAGNEDGSQNAASAPAKAGSMLTVYYTGQGELDLPIDSGSPAPASPPLRVLAPATATIGGKPAPVTANIATPDAIAIAQISLQVPAGLPKGDYPVVLTVGGVVSSAGKISVTP